MKVAWMEETCDLVGRSAVLLNVIVFDGSITFAGRFPSARGACVAVSDFLQTKPKAYNAIFIAVCCVTLRPNAVAAKQIHI